MWDDILLSSDVMFRWSAIRKVIREKEKNRQENVIENV